MREYFFYLYLIELLILIVVGFGIHKKFDKALRFFYYLLVLTLFSEGISIYFEIEYKTKAPVYHFYSILELFLISLYFLYSVFPRPRISIVFFSGLFCAILGLGNLYFFQPLITYNTNMLMIECVLIIAMALFALFKIMQQDEIVNVFSHPHFQIWIALLFLWTSTFFFWAFLDYLKKENLGYYEIIATGQTLINLFIYGYFVSVFLKLKNSPDKK